MLLGTALSACSSDDSSSAPQKEAPGTAVLAARARVLDAQGLKALQRYGADGQMDFSATSPVLSQLRTGDVLIVGVSSATPNGALVHVERVETSGVGVLLGTRRAALEEAFEELHLHSNLEVKVPPANDAKGVRDGARSVLQAGPENQGLAFPYRIEESGSAGNMVLEGALSVAPSIDLNIDIDIVQFKLSELSLSFGARETFNANFKASGAVSFDELATLASFSFTPIILTIPTPLGAVPLIFTPSLALEAGIRGVARGTVSAGVAQEAEFEVGLGYKNGSFGPFSSYDSKFNAQDPIYEASVNASAFAGPRFEVMLYGLVGPFARARAYVELNASAGGPPPCARGRVDAGLTATVGVDFNATYETTLFNESKELASFDSCSNDPNAPKPVPTWSRSYNRVGSPGDRAKAVTQLEDGTFVVIGDSSLFNEVTGFGAAIWVMRVDALGYPMWQRAFRGLSDMGRAQGVVAVSDGLLVLGNVGLMKLDFGGNLRWAKTYDAGLVSELWSIAGRADGSAIVAGHRGDPPQAWAMGLDANGEVSWSRGYGGDFFSRVRLTKDGGAIAVGQTDSNYGDLYLVKLAPNGDATWKRALDNAYDATAGTGGTPGSSLDKGYDVVEKPAGGYLAVGESYGRFPIPEPGQPGYYVAWSASVNGTGELDTGGSIVYRAPTNALYTTGYAVAMRPDGSSLIVGRRADQAADPEDVLLIQGGTFSVLGGPANDAVLSGVLQGRAAPIEITRDGGAILAATSASFAGQEQVWLVKLGRTGSIDSPYRQTVAGVSYANEHATSLSVSPSSTDIPVIAKPFTADVSSEVTDVAAQQQAP